MLHKGSQSLAHKRSSNGGTDLAPGEDSLRNEHVPKSAARVLNAQRIRDEYRKKRKLDHKDGVGKAVKRQKIEKGQNKTTSLMIHPGESLQHFNRRVEDDLRPLVKSAIQAGRAIERNVQRTERGNRDAGKKTKPKLDIPESILSQDDSSLCTPKEFATADTSRPKRLNDVVHAPPVLKKLPRGAVSSVGRKGDILSMSQKLLMEREREKVIARYRELKASRKDANEMGQQT